MTDEEIAKRIRKKDMAAFDTMMEQYNKLLWLVMGNILEKVGTPEDIEDCISDVYLKLLENPKMYNEKKGSLKSFLVRVGKNMAIDRYRKLSRGRIIELPEQVASAGEDILQSLIQKENAEKVLEAVSALKEPDREIMIRRYFFNEKIKVISEKMFLNTKEIENRLYQGKMKLKKLIRQEEAFR
ncbi:MAG: sigma-70 family RNA polymerase sigma factor [Clostridiales bacterium]|nr:sigma-70 family RNA polymerase sigma factor [Clostridiales bacterium]